MSNAEQIATQIRNNGIWDDSLNRQLCELAGLADEYDQADGDTFEDVISKAADILHVDLWGDNHVDENQSIL